MSKNPSEIVSHVRKLLKKNADEKTRSAAQNFSKEKITVHGVKTPSIRKIANETFGQVAGLKKKEFYDLCEELLASGYLEEAVVAFLWTEKTSKDFAKSDFKVLERWLKAYVTNWAACDTLCNHSIGDFLFKYPEYVEKLKGWTKSKNRWVRRGAAATLVLPARKGLFLPEIFEIATSLIEDKDDLVQKASGWMLKEASKKHQTEIFEFVVKNKDIMPRTTLRYAIEKMPDDLKKEAMKK